MEIPSLDEMTSPSVVNAVDVTKTSAVARALAKRSSQNGQGRAPSFCVRVSPTVMDLLEAAKPAKQSMVEFLRECALTVALQRLEASQN